MKLYSFIEPHRLDEKIVVEVVLTKEQVLKFYWEYWKERMETLGLSQHITEENRIEDFVVANWAVIQEDAALPPPEYGMVRMDYDMWLEYVRRMKEHENN